METVNLKIKDVEIAKNKGRFEINTAETVPEITEGTIILKGLETGDYTVWLQDENREATVAEDGLFTIEGVPSKGQVRIAKKAV